MKIRFLTEGGKSIGFGHINRCLSLAQAFRSSDYECEFYISGDDSVKNLIPDFDVNNIDWIIHPNIISQELDQNDILIFDSYKAPQTLINEISRTNKNLVFFDDFERINYPLGILINGSLNADKIYSKKTSGLIYLLGPEFQTIRKEFWDVETSKKNSSIKEVLVTFGGDDLRNLTPKVINFLNEYKPDLIKNIIVGKSFRNTESINIFSNKKTKIFFNPTATQLCEIMRQSDIAICGAGQTLNELARIKTPTLYIGIAENQKNNIESWSKHQYFNFVGWWNNDNIIGRLYESFIKFDENFEQLAEDIFSAELIIDGNGSNNIVEKVLSYVRTK
jgi:UDP-2,4-diacetamido-2,4,6-trideoxy-beta-L-altropyranose hydrolase